MRGVDTWLVILTMKSQENIASRYQKKENLNSYINIKTTIKSLAPAEKATMVSLATYTQYEMGNLKRSQALSLPTATKQVNFEIETVFL